MRGPTARAVRFLAFPTIVLVGVAIVAPGRLEVAVRVYSLVIAVVVLALLLGALRRVNPAAIPLRQGPPGARTARETPVGLTRLEHEAALAVADAFDLHYRLRPRLRTLASGLLASRRGISLDREPERARLVLGEETFGLVREDRPPPEDRHARGLPLRALGKVVESLEQI